MSMHPHCTHVLQGSAPQEFLCEVCYLLLITIIIRQVYDTIIVVCRSAGFILAVGEHITWILTLQNYQ